MNVCKKCGNEMQEGELYCSKCGKPINAKSKKKYIPIIIVVILLLAGAGGVMVTPKVIQQVKEKNYQAEMQRDLENIEIALNTEELILPVGGTYNQNLYENQNEDILEDATDYTKYEKFVKNYKGGTLEITGNVDISKIGTYEVEYKITSEKGSTKTTKLNVKVQDFMRPDINIENETVQVNKGTEVNLLDGVTAQDNVDDGTELTAKITTEGTVDVNTAGEYEVVYKVTDNSGWSTERTRTYKVVEEKNIKIGTTYAYRIRNENYNNGYADTTVVFKANNKIQFTDIDGMDIIPYTGTYTLKNGVITAKVSFYDADVGGSNKTVKFNIIDQNTIKNTSNGYTYKAR